jgi:type IV pilus assembly protein PilA
MNSRKGFTLIELLAVIVILGIIMIVAVPNVISVINKQEKNTYINDAKKLITMAKYRISSDTDINYPKNNGIVYLEYDFVNNGDITVDSDGKAYSNDNSFVVLAMQNSYIMYYVQLISDGKGISFISEEDLAKDTAINNVNSLADAIVGDNKIALVKGKLGKDGEALKCTKKDGCKTV